MVLTGHSLGGGVGAIVSARQQVPAVIFSGPNAVLSRLKFNVTEEQLNAWPIKRHPWDGPSRARRPPVAARAARLVPRLGDVVSPLGPDPV